MVWEPNFNFDQVSALTTESLCSVGYIDCLNNVIRTIELDRLKSKWVQSYPIVLVWKKWNHQSVYFDSQPINHNVG
ncbi:hypothetical protein QWZ16_09425 [Vibrio ostreicida]|uniref:Neurotransmitter-gated ion-channel ligand-binding domain-containing protein n=1 Tax=Vibrio ostreicida TaxID=526588 RepID=A0ABT8BSK2_9VIBR|nr:hypothetical protein [Vibrio ostreicida]MDN3609918.1 hypothetical protein [Vibrio ostreicida]